MTELNKINQWMTPKEITQLSGMPKSIQGIHKKASKEGWKRRPQAGRRGPGVEYFVVSGGVDHIDVSRNKGQTGTYAAEILSLFGLLISKLSESELKEIEGNLVRNGLSILLHGISHFTKESAMEKLAISSNSLNTALMLEKLPDAERREILAKYGIAEQSGPVAPTEELPKRKKVS